MGPGRIQHRLCGVEDGLLVLSADLAVGGLGLNLRAKLAHRLAEVGERAVRSGVAHLLRSRLEPPLRRVAAAAAGDPGQGDSPGECQCGVPPRRPSTPRRVGSRDVHDRRTVFSRRCIACSTRWCAIRGWPGVQLAEVWLLLPMITAAMPPAMSTARMTIASTIPTRWPRRGGGRPGG